MQLVESAGVLAIVLAGSWWAVGGSSPGEALAWYVVSYGALRFLLEFARGDPDRPQLLGFSEAHWTSVLLMTGAVLAGRFGVMPFEPEYEAAAAAVILTLLGAHLFPGRSRRRLAHPSHVREIAEVLGSLRVQPTFKRRKVPVACTSLGLRISASATADDDGPIQHFAISFQERIMSEQTARTLSQLILKLVAPGAANRLIRGNRGVFHLLLRSG